MDSVLEHFVSSQIFAILCLLLQTDRGRKYALKGSFWLLALLFLYQNVNPIFFLSLF
jgi:hypothetical protein